MLQCVPARCAPSARCSESLQANLAGALAATEAAPFGDGGLEPVAQANDRTDAAVRRKAPASFITAS
jgi:hypothetical protein